jgi:hypothetical protein
VIELVLATTNLAKVARLQWMLADSPSLGVRPGPRLEVAEGARSLVDNALAKARAWAAATSAWAIATDGGLEVPALGAEWNPVLTGRQGAATLLALLAPRADAARLAYQRESVVVVDATGAARVAIEVRSAPRWVARELDRAAAAPEAGFWLPSVLRYGPTRRAAAELSPADRAQLDDHWAAVRDRLRAALLTPPA